MYEEHFGFSKNPFQSVAEGEAVFEGPAQTKVIADLKTALTAKDSIAVITGPVGVGKTTIVQCAMEQMGPERLVAILGRTQVGSDDLVALLLAQFGVDRETTRRFECLESFNRILNEQADAGARVFIVIEDAERLGAELLEELEALTASDGGTCAGANMVLMGPQKLDKLIAKPSLERVRQRIRLQQTLDRFTADEVELYLRHRIKAAGGEFDAAFEEGTSLMVRRCTGGIPRVINSLCETALTVAAEDNISRVTGKIVFKVAVEVFGMSPGDAPASQAPKVMPPPKPMAPAAAKPEPVAKKPASVAASPAAAADKISDPTIPVPKMPSAPGPGSEPQQTTTPRAPKPPANAATSAAKPAAPAAPVSKPAANKPLPELPSKFKFAEEIVVDRNTKPKQAVQPPKKPDLPELPTLEFADGAPKTVVEKPQIKKAPSTAANDMPTLGDSARVEKVAPAVKKDEPKPPAKPAATAAKAAAAPAGPAPAKAAPTPSLEEPDPPAVRSEPKVGEQTASFAKVDHDMLDAALASLAVHDEQDKPEPEEQAPAGSGAPASIPEVTLDQSIEAKLAEVKVATDPAELHKMAAELEKTQSLEDMSDKLAETLFGSEELEAISLQIREETLPAEDSPVALEPASAAGAAVPADAPATPAPQVAKASAEPAPAIVPNTAPKLPAAPKPAANIQTGSEPAAAAAPPPQERGPQLEPIENQFNTSMTATLKTLNKRNKPPADDTDSEQSSGGLLGRLKDTFKS